METQPITKHSSSYWRPAERRTRRTRWTGDEERFQPMIELRTLERHTAASQLVSVQPICTSSAAKDAGLPLTSAVILTAVRLVNPTPSSESMICSLRLHPSTWRHVGIRHILVPASTLLVPFHCTPVTATVQTRPSPPQPTLIPWKSNRKQGFSVKDPTPKCAGPFIRLPLGVNKAMSLPDEGLKGDLGGGIAVNPLENANR